MITMKQVIDCKGSAYNKKDGKKNVDVNSLTIEECASILVTPDGMGMKVKIEVINKLIEKIKMA